MALLMQIVLPPLTLSDGKPCLGCFYFLGLSLHQGAVNPAQELSFSWFGQSQMSNRAQLQLSSTLYGVCTALVTKSSLCCASLSSPLSLQVLPGVSLPVFLAWCGLALL